MSEHIQIKQIVDAERIRTDLGDIDGLCTSIKKFGLIQPIVLGTIGDEIILIAGGRRLAALRRLSYTTLYHGAQYVWRDEVNEGEDKKLRFKSMEIEENVKRKDLSWQEQVEGKRQLLQIMQTIHGVAKPGPTFKDEKGFGTNRLAAMLGEAQSNTSRDLQLAEAMAQIPGLKNAETKAQAYTQLKILGSVISMHRAAVPTVGDATVKSWVLYERDFREKDGVTWSVEDASVDLIWTDLPYGANLTNMSLKSSTGATFDDRKEQALDLIPAIAAESFRVLRNDRYAVFCFGFDIYHYLVMHLESAGFNVALVPFIWVKNTKSTENPLSMYSNAYEPLLVARKGSPAFMVPGQSNVINLPVVQDRLQIVQKPVELVEKFLRDMTTENATVVDFCAGTCTTGVACHNLKRRSILFEKSPSMAAIGRARLGALK
jgi:site-specific DNA-methyltransferase (adenine-specific)